MFLLWVYGRIAVGFKKLVKWRKWVLRKFMKSVRGKCSFHSLCRISKWHKYLICHPDNWWFIPSKYWDFIYPVLSVPRVNSKFIKIIWGFIILKNHLKLRNTYGENWCLKLVTHMLEVSYQFSILRISW